MATMKAIDTLHMSSVKTDNILPGEEFECSDADGKLLEERGLATMVKAAPAPKNKMDAAPANKAKAPISADSGKK